VAVLPVCGIKIAGNPRQHWLCKGRPFSGQRG